MNESHLSFYFNIDWLSSIGLDIMIIKDWFDLPSIDTLWVMQWNQQHNHKDMKDLAVHVISIRLMMK